MTTFGTPIASPGTGGVVVHFDGACQPPAGPQRIATWAFTVVGGGLDHEASGLAARPFSPESTNNVAEYAGAIHALEYLLEKGYRGPVEVIGDSELVIRQMNGEYQVRAAHLQPFHDRLQELSKAFSQIRFVAVPREQNTRADELTKYRIQAARRSFDLAGLPSLDP